MSMGRTHTLVCGLLLGLMPNLTEAADQSRGALPASRETRAIAQLTASPLQPGAVGLQPIGPFDVRAAGSPPAPILGRPADNQGFTDPGLYFNWRDGDGVPRATSFRLCITEPNVACDAPGALLYPPRGQTPLTGTLFAVPGGIPSALHGKQLQWTVAACAPNTQVPALSSAGGENCTYATSRRLRWEFPAPYLVAPARGTVLDPVKPTLAWNYGATVGLTRFMLCLAQPGVTCGTAGGSHLVEFRDLNTRSHTLGNDILRWLEGYTVQWTVGACNASRLCMWGNSETFIFPNQPGSYLWIRPIVQHPKCTNCHGMDSKNATYQTHVEQRRFPANTAPTVRENCAACHTQSNGFANSWRAPSRFKDFTPGTGTISGCSQFRGVLDRRNLVRHMKEDELVLWGIDRIPGLTRAAWQGFVDNWDGIGLRCPQEESGTLYNPWYRIGQGAKL